MKSLRTVRKLPPTVKLTLVQNWPSGVSMILELLKLWMTSKAPPMDMDPPLTCPMIPTMIYSYLSMPVLGMIKTKKTQYR